MEGSKIDFLKRQFVGSRSGLLLLRGVKQYWPGLEFNCGPRKHFHTTSTEGGHVTNNVTIAMIASMDSMIYYITAFKGCCVRWNLVCGWNVSISYVPSVLKMFSKFQRIMWFWASKWLRIFDGCLKKDPIKFDHGLTYSRTESRLTTSRRRKGVKVTSQ